MAKTGSPDHDISDHIQTHVGPPLDMALREIVGLLRIQVVPASDSRPYLTLVTTGTSEVAMPAPKGFEDYRYVELFMHLPADWPLTEDSWKAPEHYWPIEWMRRIAHYPETSPVFLGPEQTLGHSPPEPFAPNTELSSIMLLPDPTPFGSLRLSDGRTVRFYELFPLYEEERVLKRDRGTHELLKLFQLHGVSKVVDPHRVNVAIASRISRQESDGA